MSTKMTVLITVKGDIDSADLYRKVKDFAHVTDMGDKTYVYSIIDIREDVIEKIISICEKYGECEVSAQRVKE